ncbi:hypothetical protein EYZ11_007346 [Aspergillus tanneri]|uniref:Uncharacterized protein n=1 Tax=Aspergillus tanneri TaxID=1220188 RepID=A0A4S3JFG5_9EURO|nr:uncharacterized protein ATNIH1004_000808 [Aspergillus tanneri]KAA8651909.1 hypothetical protein ATNIH1004_000808 [Aspergillus tanneri]THC93167.1 hypothetical protein EYZ11_007346 [Aspergillus tanneri]
MANSDYSNPESLDILTAMVNQTLIETGRFFRSQGSMQSRAQLKRSIPAAHEQFQCALDSLSEQIFIAKAFLERDYDAIKARKAALQPVQEAVRGESSMKQEPEAAPEPEGTAVDASQIESKSAEDITSAQPLTGANITEQGSAETAVKAEKPDETATAPELVLSGPTEINFDSVLNDTGAGANEFDLNLDFGNDDLGNENFLSGSNVDGANTGITDQGGKGGESLANQASDFPGMENQDTSMPTGGDAFDLELQKAEGFSGIDGTQDDLFGGNTEDIMAPGESSFDDLFMESENFGSGGVGDPNLLEGDGLMNINELDDSWFT